MGRQMSFCKRSYTERYSDTDDVANIECGVYSYIATGGVNSGKEAPYHRRLGLVYTSAFESTRTKEEGGGGKSGLDS